MPLSCANAFRPTMALLYCRNHLGGAGQHRALDVAPVRHDIGAGLDRHHDFFQRGVARPLPDAVDGGLNLTRATLDARQRVGDGETQIVMAVHREDRFIRVRHPLANGDEHPPVFVRHRIADGVRQVDGGGARRDRGLHAFAQIINRSAGRVHRRPFDILDQVASLLHRGGDDLQHLRLALAHLMRQMDRRRGNEGMDAAPTRVSHGFAGAGDIAGNGARQTCDDRVPGVSGDLRDRFEITDRSDREAGFDDIDSHVVEHLGDFDLLLEGHGGAGALLAVAQRGVENNDAVLVGLVRGCHGNDPLVSAPCGALEGLASLRSP